MLGPGDFLVVAVAENHREVTVGDHLVVVVFLVDAVGDTLVADGLAGTVEAPVGKENRTLVWPALAVVIIHVIGICRGKGLSLVRDKKGQAGTARSYFEEPVGIGTGGLKLDVAIVALALPGTNRRPLDGFARYSVEHEALEGARTVAGTHDQGQVAHPETRVAHSILLLAELRVMTGEKKIGTGLQILGGIDLLDPFLEIIGGGKIDRPFLEGLLVKPLPLAAMIDVLGVALGQFHPAYPIKGNDPEVSLGQVAVAQLNLGQGSVPDPLRGNGRGLGLELTDQVLAFLAPHAIGKNRRPALGQLMGFDEFPFAPQDLGMTEHGSGRHLMIGPFLGKTL